MNVLLQLAFLSYYRYSFFLVDLLIFLLILFGFYHLIYKILPPLVPENKKEKYEWVRNALSILLGIQLGGYLFLMLLLLPRKPILVHFRASAGLAGFVLVLLIILRLINTLMVAAFMTTCWMFLGKENRTTYVRRWFILMGILLLYYLWTMFYMIFPTMNRALRIYEMFYHIRNLYLVNTPQKKYKTFLFLQQHGCIPPSYYDLYRNEWERTFQGPVMVPTVCSR